MEGLYADVTIITENLDESTMRLLDDPLQLYPPGHSKQFISFSDLANATHFILPGNIVDLEQVITYYRDTLRLCSPEHQNRSIFLNNLANAIHTRFDRQCDIVDLQEVIECNREALRLCLPDNRPRFLNDLARALRARFVHQTNIADLEEAIKYNRESLQLCPSGHPDHSHFLNGLARALSTRFEWEAGVADLEEAIDCNRESLKLCPRGHPNRPRSLADLVDVLITRFEQQGTDLEEAIELSREAVALCLPGHPDRSLRLNDLARALKTRFEQHASATDLEEAITCHRESLTFCPPGHPSRYQSLNGLARALRTRFEQLAKSADLEEAINCNRESLELCSTGHPNRFQSLIDIANALRTRFEQQGTDLEEAIKFNREAVALCPLGHIKRFDALLNLSNPLQTRHFHQGNIADLDEAINCNRESVNLCPPGNSNRFTCLVNLAYPLRARFSQLNNPADLEETVRCNREALKLCPLGHPSRYHSLVHLANSLGTRFQRQNNIVDLEEAVKCGREALQLCPLPNRYFTLINLANAINTRFEQLGDIDDLKEVIKCHTEALYLCPQPNRYYSLKHLANAMRTYFEQQGHQEGNLEDLGVAIQYHRDALQLCPLGHPNRFSSLLNLSNSLQTRGYAADLEEAIKLNRESLELCTIGHPHRSVSLGSLAKAICALFDQQGWQNDVAGLQEAIDYYHEALDCLPPHHPLRTTQARGLATAYIRRYHSIGNQADLDEVFRLYDEAAVHSAASSLERFRASLEWVSAAQQYPHESGIRAYSICLTLLQRCTLASSNVHFQHDTLARMPKSLASDAAACAIQNGHLETAVELLEQGRSILWSRLSGYRDPLEKLREVNEDLANEFEKISRQLESTAVSSVSLEDSESHNSMEDDAQKYQLLSETWDLIVGRIRLVSGFHSFLESEPFDHLRKGAINGPVIIINISKLRSDAIIIRYTEAPILVHLPNATPEAVRIISKDLLETLGFDSNDKSRGQRICMTLRVLWDLVVGSIVPPLRSIAAMGSRIWWCPTSTLCSLPLHGAGPWKGGKPNIPDLFISSYTPTLSALVRADTHGIKATTARASPEGYIPHFVAIGVPKSTGYKDLDAVPKELAEIENIAPHVKLLQDKNATCRAVIQDVCDHQWVHISCHGEQDVTQPFNSSFRLYDGPLTLHDIIQAHLADPEFAFLSACHTATGDERTPDEIIHLAAGLQFAGFRSVVGTLWAMEDKDGPEVARTFYEHMFRETGKAVDYRDAAKGLNLVTQRLRRLEVPKDRWVNFIHIGV